MATCGIVTIVTGGVNAKLNRNEQFVLEDKRKEKRKARSRRERLYVSSMLMGKKELARLYLSSALGFLARSSSPSVSESAQDVPKTRGAKC